MLRPILALIELWIVRHAIHAKRAAALAGAAVIAAIASALTANLALAAAVYLAFEPAVGPARAALIASGAAMLLGAMLVGAILWVSARAQRGGRKPPAPASPAEASDPILLAGTLASAFLAGVISGMERQAPERQTPPRRSCT
jgi:hypothetical protein